MIYIIAQTFGILATVTCFTVPLFKRKRQMLVAAIGSNLFIALNFILLGEFGSGALLSCLGIVQIVFNLWPESRDEPVPVAEKVIFFVLMIAIGAVGVRKPIDLLPIVAGALFMISVFMKNEQVIRKYLLGNAILWTIYDISVGSTSAFAHAISIFTTGIALYRYRKQKATREEGE